MLNCHKLNGTFTRPITVETNDPEHRTVSLTCKGHILEAIKLEPALMNFGRVTAGEDSAEIKVAVSRGDAGPIKPVLRPIDSAEFKVELREIEAGERYELVGRAHPQPSDNMVRGKLVLETGVTQQPTIDLTIYGTVMPRVSLRPGAVILPRDADTNWEQTVDLAWVDGSTHKVLDATSDFSKLEASVVEVEAKPRIVVRLKEPLGDEAIPRQLAIHLTTDDPKAEKLDIPVQYRRQVVRPRHTRTPPKIVGQPLNPKAKANTKAKSKSGSYPAPPDAVDVAPPPSAPTMPTRGGGNGPTPSPAPQSSDAPSPE